MTDVAGIRPRMSVVIPHYNHVDLLPEALDAIARQTMPPFEVVVVDDGSTDESVARLESLATKLPWLRICRHPGNRGVNAACNTGLDLVSGDFVLFSAADDRLSTTMVEHAFAAAAAFPQIGVLFSDHAEMSADGADTRVVPLDLPPARRCFSSDEFVRLMQSHFFYFHVSNVWFNVALLSRTRRVPARGEMARRPARGLCGCVRTWRRLHARRPVVCPHIANVLWRGRVAQQRSAGSLALLARADQTARVGAPPRRSRRGRGLAGLSPAGGPRLGRRSRLYHASTGKAARLAVDLDQAGTGFRYWLSPLGPCRQNTISSPVMAHALRLLSFAHGVAPATAGVPAVFEFRA